MRMKYVRCYTPISCGLPHDVLSQVMNGGNLFMCFGKSKNLISSHKTKVCFYEVVVVY